MLEYRVAQQVTNGAQRVATAKFTKKVMFSKVNHNITKNLGYFYNKINDPKLLKIAQSGHTALFINIELLDRECVTFSS